MGLLGGLIGGVIAGVIGALAWAGISYGTGYEIGWIAWIIGGMVGLGVAVGDRRESGTPAGILAAVIAIISILGGKYLAVDWIIAKGFDADQRLQMGQDAANDDEFVLSFVADEVAMDWTEAGRAVNWPDGVDPNYAALQTDYPTDVWAEAQRRWAGLSHSEQQAYRADARDTTLAGADLLTTEFRGELAREGFIQSFGLFDVLFFGLAIVTAFKVGASEIGGS